MARRGMRGQLHMFDFVRSLDVETSGEVEMVSLMPDFDEPEVEELAAVELTLSVEEAPTTEPELDIEEAPTTEPELDIEEVPTTEPEPDIEEVPTAEPESVIEAKPPVEKENVAMSRRYKVDGKEIEIAYINYNKVRITREGEAPTIKEFASTKEAVDFYVEQIQEEDTDE